jgi:hypothetical protein
MPQQKIARPLGRKGFPPEVHARFHYGLRRKQTVHILHYSTARDLFKVTQSRKDGIARRELQCKLPRVVLVAKVVQHAVCILYLELHLEQ